uniref:Coiled-coil domain containing 102B n=1 Tax=Pelusios castaneus TaxID=367368 RepID=A0A8C8RBT1_9SAUR
MNLDSVHKLSDKTQVLRIQQRQSYEIIEGSKAADNYCNSSLPSQRLQPYPSPHPCMRISNDNDWEISEALRLRELEEVKARAAQMEKTMRWWSDCTANWREKWSKVRTERNKAREEGRQLRIKLETTMKELSALKKLNQDLLSEKEEWEAEVIWKKKPSLSEVPCTREKGYPIVSLKQEPLKDVIKFVVQETHKVMGTINLYLTFSEICIFIKMHFFLEKEVEKLDSDLSQWKWKYGETQQSKEESPEQVCWLTNPLTSPGAKKRSFYNFFSLFQLEEKESESTSEWGKQEILETEKQDLERETRRLKTQVKEIQERLDRRNKQTASNLSSDVKTERKELLEKNKELTDIQREHNKLNKQYHEKVAELMHANKRVEQHEAEVKKLRIRVEDLKRGLNQAENKLDDSLNQIRKLQQSLDEKTEANDNLQVQLNHLKSSTCCVPPSLGRIKNMLHSGSASYSVALLLSHSSLHTLQ